MEKYQRGKIYAIKCRKTGRTYIGSTCEPTLAKRLAKHVKDFKLWEEGKNYMTSFEIIKDGEYYIILLELCPCNSRDELRMCEQKHIDSCECLNKVKAFQSKEERLEYIKQHYQQHRVQIAEKRKQNRDELNAKARERIYCPNCQKEMNFSSLSAHKKICPQLKNEIDTDGI